MRRRFAPLKSVRGNSADERPRLIKSHAIDYGPQRWHILCRRHVLRYLLCVIGAIVVLAASALAQSDRGTITGTVADSSGAVVPGAKVVLINSGTSVRQETTTTETGNYAVAAMPAGR